MKELIATNATTGMTIIERYIEGIKYIKVTPANLMPMIMENLEKQFGDKIKIIERNGWIKIMKTEEVEQDTELIEGEVKKLVKPEDVIDEGLILNKEAAMLKQQGFQVQIKEIKE